MTSESTPLGPDPSTQPDPVPVPDPIAEAEPCHIDITVPHMARVYDYLLGGTVNFAVDREHAEFVGAALPGGIEAARANVRANRVFLRDAVRFLAGQRRVRQFLDIGTGIPNKDNVHAVAQQTAADARIVYVDHDPVVLAHAHELLRTTSEGTTAYIPADLCEPEHILREAAKTLDLERPVAVMLVGILHYVLGEQDPYGIVTRLLDAVVPGSYLVVSHLASDIQPEEMAELASRHNQPRPAEIMELRNCAEVLRFFDGLDMVGPGLVPIDRWHPPASAATSTAGTSGDHVVPIYGGVGRKPS